MIPVGVLFLAAFVSNTLYIQVDSNVQEAFICLSANNTKNDTWPSSWKRLDYKSNGIYIYKFEGNVSKSSSVYYKLRFYFVDRNYEETKEWNLLYAKPCECYYNIVIVSTLLIILCIFMLFYAMYYIYLNLF